MRKIITPFKVSEDFTNSTKGGSAHSVECDCCGRINVGMLVDDEHKDTWADINHDLEYIQQVELRNVKNPDDYVLHYDRYWIRYSKLSHMLLPDDCICNALRWYEDFILGNMDMIDQYKVMMTLKSE